MKMPERRYFPMALPPDMFGLPSLSLMSQAGETNAERQQRVEAVEAGIRKTFVAAVRQLGEDEARALFRRVTRQPKRGPGKDLAPDRDYQLLTAYDAAMVEGTSVAALARDLRKAGTTLGNTPEAIALQIRRVVKERDKRRHQAAADARYHRMAMRNEAPSLLSAAVSRKKGP